MTSPAPTSSLADRRERIGNAIVRVGKAYWYVVTIFIGGMLGGFLAAKIAPYLPLPKAWAPQRVKDIAWVAGALVVAIGAPLGWITSELPKRNRASR